MKDTVKPIRKPRVLLELHPEAGGFKVAPGAPEC